MTTTPINIPSELQGLSHQLWNTLSTLRTVEYPIVYTVTIDCNTLPHYSIGEGCYNHASLKPFFDRLLTLNHPLVYWFEISSSHTGQQVFDMMKTYRDSANRKNFPALKKVIDPNSRIVYVGKSKRRTNGRMYTHLGYYHIPGTAGLQLAHWAVGTGLVLRVNFIELPLSWETQNLASLYEQRLANILRPLAGKHNM